MHARGSERVPICVHNRAACVFCMVCDKGFFFLISCTYGCVCVVSASKVDTVEFAVFAT